MVQAANGAHKLPPAETIFGKAITIDDALARARYLDDVCGSNSAIRAEVERLVKYHFQAGDFLDRPAIAVETRDLSPATPAIGTSIGPYKLLEQIGEGGMGLVYMAEQQRPVRRLVALKIIKPGMDSKQVIARFEAERQALALMDHPHIAKVLDGGTTDAGRPYFVMELVRGIPINQFCDEKRMAVRERLAVFVQVCQAVQHAHQKGIIHRDLKPTNVLVTMHDSVPVPMVIDFGIVKALGQSLTEHTLHTGFAQLVGTPLYMSPEQAEMNQHGVDTRSDVYSLGVMLYELLTGTTPFEKETLTKVGLDEMRRIIREDEPPRPSSRVSTLAAHALCTVSNCRNIDSRRISPSLRGELDWIVMRALEKERNRRYESASAVARDVERYLHGELVHACPPSAAYRVRKFAKKYKATFTTASLLAASLLLGATLSFWQALRATAAEAEATTNAAHAAANEAKAKNEEQKATALARAEAAQRRQAENNFDAALDAVDRMLAHLNDEELKDVPRIGPLRRKILDDAIAFYQRIPLHSADSIATKYRLGQTWYRIADLAREVNSFEDARSAYNRAISLLTRVVEAQPKSNEYQLALASVHSSAGWFFHYDLKDQGAAENSFEISNNLVAQMANPDRALQANGMMGRGLALFGLGKREEAMDSFRRGLHLLDRSQPRQLQVHATILQNMAAHTHDRAESIDLYRRAIKEYRQCLAGRQTHYFERSVFASLLNDAAVRIAASNKEEAEQLWDESIELRKSAYAETPTVRLQLASLVRVLQYYANHLSLRTNNMPLDAQQIGKRDTIVEELIRSRRELVSRFALLEDRFPLVKVLEQESKYLLNQATQAATIPPPNSVDAPSLNAEPRTLNPSDLKLRADALLTEAIQLARALAAEFPENADYKSRLADLEKLHAQHFGPKDNSSRTGEPAALTDSK